MTSGVGGNEVCVRPNANLDSVLTNLATLAPIANSVTDNFILLIVYNGSYGSTGDQPTYAGDKTSLAAAAEACG